MTREEKQKAIDALKISAPVMAVTQEEFNTYIQTLNKIMDWLEQEPVLDKIKTEIEKKYPSCQSTGESTGYAEAVEDFLQIIEKYEEPKTKGRSLDADELLKRIAEKCKTPSLSEDTVNGLCGATAIIYDMLNESEQELLRARLRESGQECD